MTTIEWTRGDDGRRGMSWNPVRARNLETGRVGWHCEPVHAGCKLCYAGDMNETGRWAGTGLPYKPAHRKDVDIYLDVRKLLEPLSWQKPRRCFVCSMTDVDGDFVERSWRNKIRAVQALTPHITYIELTKRPGRRRDYFNDPAHYAEVAYQLPGIVAAAGLPIERGFVASETLTRLQAERAPLPNVWGGVSCSEQKDLDAFLPILKATLLAKRLISFEPLLEQIWAGDALRGIDWALVGFESGTRDQARAGELVWMRSLLAQCRSAGVAPFIKQLGTNPRENRRPVKLAPRDLHGRDPRGWPEDLRVREFPPSAPIAPGPGNTEPKQLHLLEDVA